MKAWLPHLTRLFSIAAAATLFGLLFTTAYSGYVPFEFKMWHPLLMVTGFVLLLPSGLVTYVSSYGPRLNAKFPDRSSRRVLHGVVQLIGSLLIVTGYLVEFTYHIDSPGEHIAVGESIAVKLHVWFGIAVIVGILVQLVSGIYKFVLKTRDSSNPQYSLMINEANGKPEQPVMEHKYRWHGKLGPAVWVLGLVVISLAVYFKFYSSTLAGAVAVWLLLLGLVASGLTELFTAPRPPAPLDDHRGDDASDAGGSSRLMNEQLLRGGGRGGAGGMVDPNTYDAYAAMSMGMMAVAAANGSYDDGYAYSPSANNRR